MHYKFTFFIILFFITGCVEKSLHKDFDNNVDKLNDFFHSKNKEADDEQILIYSGDREIQPECQKATIKANNMSLAEFVTILSHLYKANINYSSNINISENSVDVSSSNEDKKISTKNTTVPQESEKIYINMTDVCINDVFDSLVENYNIGIKKLSYGYSIYPKQLRTHTFSVNYHNFYRKGKSSISIANSHLREEAEKDNYSSITSESGETFWQSINDTISSILNVKKSNDDSSTLYKREGFYVYKESGLIVVTAYPKQLRYIEQFLSKVNKNSTSQVLIEAKVLEVELRDEFNTGVQWDLLKQNLRYTSFAALNSPILGNGAIHISNNRGFNAVMQALSSQGKISVISSPRVLALHNQRALIKSGEDRYFVTNVTNLTLDNTAANATTQSGFDLEPFFSGVALDTTPRILSSKEVLLHIHPMISRVEDENKLITIDNRDTRIPVAMIQSREADAVVKATSGDIIILGGMTQNYVKLDQSGLPIKPKGFLSNLTNLFSAKQQLSKKVELIILIKPTIINNFDDFENIGTLNL